MTKEYGYFQRPDMPERPVAGGVTVPRNQWPRKVKSGLSGASGVARNFLALLNSSNADIIGAGLTMSESTSNGTIVATANGWDATWSRTGRLIDLTGNAAGMGSCRSYSRWELSPAAMCQGNAAGTSGYFAPYVIRISAVVAARSTTMPGGGSAGAAFGLSNYTLLPILIPTYAAVQFVSTWDDPDVAGEWTTWVASTAGPTHSSNILISTNEPHLLVIEFDAPNGTINFYIDGALVDSYTPNDGDVFTHATYGSNIEYVANASNGTVTRLLTLADTVPLVSVDIVDLEDGT